MIYEYCCLNGHSDEFYIKTYKDKGCETYICKECGHSMGSIISKPKPMVFFEEGRGRWINNLGPEPVFVRSHAEHKALMKKRGVELAGAMPGQKGRWI